MLGSSSFVHNSFLHLLYKKSIGSRPNICNVKAGRPRCPMRCDDATDLAYKFNSYVLLSTLEKLLTDDTVHSCCHAAWLRVYRESRGVGSPVMKC